MKQYVGLLSPRTNIIRAELKPPQCLDILIKVTFFGFVILLSYDLMICYATNVGVALLSIRMLGMTTPLKPKQMLTTVALLEIVR